MLEKHSSGFYVKLLGGFSITYEGQELTIDGNLRSKYLQLMLVLIQAGAAGVPRKKLVDTLQKESDDWKKQLNTLRQQVFGLRRTLAECGFPEAAYISVSKGSYYFTKDIPWETDTHRIDELYQSLKGIPAEEEDTRVEVLRKICHLYAGEFLPMLNGEEWATIESASYQKIYFDSLSELCEILKKRKEYEELLELCTIASELHPYDEWQAVQIDCLMAKNRYMEALKVYEKATEIFYDELGISPFDNIMARYRNSKGQVQYAAGAMMDLKDGLEENGNLDEAYQCSYPSFIDIYRTMARMEERNTVKSTLLVCDLKAGHKISESEESLLSKQAETFRQVMAKAIRIADVYTRYSPTQFLILLLGTENEDGQEVADRLKNTWKRITGDDTMEIEFIVQKLEAAER